MIIDGRPRGASFINKGGVTIKKIRTCLAFVLILALALCQPLAAAQGVVPVTGVTLDEHEIEIAVDYSRALIATVTPEDAADKGVTWTSSDPKTATVTRDGLVEGVSLGNTVITVKTNDGGFTDSCNVRVGKKVTGVLLDQNNLPLLLMGIEYTLTAIVQPYDAANQGVKWSTSNEKIATVADGTVKGVSAGQAVITVTTDEGGFKSTCMVNVVDPGTPTEYGLDYNIRSIAVGQKAALPDIPKYTGTWSVNDESIAAIQNGMVVGGKLGITQLVFTVADGAKLKINGKQLKPGESYELIELRVRNKEELAKSISVKPKKLELNLSTNSSAMALPIIKPATTLDKEIFWKSSNEKVALILLGAIFGLAPGKAKITVMTTTLKKATIDVTVIQPKPAKVTVVIRDTQGAVLKKAKIDLGQTLQLTSFTSDMGGVTWSSNKPNVATVDDAGLVTAVKKGKATITAKAKNGGGKATCKITVR